MYPATFSILACLPPCRDLDTPTLGLADCLACLSLAEDRAGVELWALAVGLLALEPLAEADISGVTGLVVSLGRLDFLKSLRESFQLTWRTWDWLRLVLAVDGLSFIMEVLDDVVLLLNFDFDLALAIISPDDPSSSSEPSF